MKSKKTKNRTRTQFFALARREGVDNKERSDAGIYFA
jgi:hypothetical protein